MTARFGRGAWPPPAHGADGEVCPPLSPIWRDTENPAVEEEFDGFWATQQTRQIGASGNYGGSYQTQKHREPPAPQPNPARDRPALQIQRGSHAGLLQRRPTDPRRHLTFKLASNVINAVAFSHSTGHPLTVGMNIIWAHLAEFRDDRLTMMTTRLFDLLTRWLVRHARIALRAAWVRERGLKKGHHLHALTNIPVQVVPSVQEYLTRAFDISPNGLKFSTATYGMKTPSMQMGYARYMCKSLDPAAFLYRDREIIYIVDRLGIRPDEIGGAILVKRAGTTENLGRKARTAAGWKDARLPDEVAALLNPDPGVRSGLRRTG
jgi:hypothetical protein